MNEFEAIKHFFKSKNISRPDVFLGIGDDAAIVTPPENQQIVMTTDTLISGVHFPKDTAAFDIGFKSLAVNLSDLAAMGATPAWISLALTLPEINETWLKDFAQGFFTLATKYQAQLIGGDLTQGPLSITIQAQGLVPFGEAIRRDQAKPGDLIYVTHTVGDAGLALLFLQNKISLPTEYHENILAKLNRPTPQIKIGETLRGVAHAAIDISDGLAADLMHILQMSAVGAEINVDLLPLSNTMRTQVNKNDALRLALSGGDDYELCFTAPLDKKNQIPKNCTVIGKITDTHKLALRFQDGREFDLNKTGYQHFKRD